MSFSIIAAIGKNRELGKDNDLVWHIPADLKRFKKITAGHTVIMGRLTFNSIRNKPLPKRRNIILTRSEEDFPGVEVVHSINEVKQLVDANEEVFILGGATIYEQFLPVTDKMYLTIIDKDYPADTFFPTYNLDNWEVIEQTDVYDDDEAGVNYSFITYARIK